MQAEHPQWLWSHDSQQYYFYDTQNEAIVFQDGRRMRRPSNAPRTAFISTSRQATTTTSPPSLTLDRAPLHSEYNSLGSSKQQDQQYSARRSNQHGPIADPSRSEADYQGSTRRSLSPVDALPSSGASVTVSKQYPESNSSRHPQPVVPQVRTGSDGQRIIEAADPNTQLRTVIQTAPVQAITDPALLRSGIRATRMLLPSDNDPVERLFKTFRQREQPRKFFTVGRVFAILWVEPAGESSTQVTNLEAGTTTGRFGESVFSKVRRFVVIREGDKYCSALPITSYGHRGVGKPGVNKSEHSIIYTTKHPPDPLPTELPVRGEDGMRPNPIRVDTDDPIDKLDSLSRIDYGKVHTIQHNIKVKPFGKVNPKSMFALTNQFGNVWRALPTGQASISRNVEESEQPIATAQDRTATQLRSSMQSARVLSNAGSSSLQQTQSAAKRASTESDQAAMLRADVRAAVRALVKQGHTETQAERAIREGLARRRQNHDVARQQESEEEEDDDDSSDEDDDDDSGSRSSDNQRRQQGQRQQTASSQSKSESAQKSSTRTPKLSEGTSATVAAQSQKGLDETATGDTSQNVVRVHQIATPPAGVSSNTDSATHVMQGLEPSPAATDPALVRGEGQKLVQRAHSAEQGLRGVREAAQRQQSTQPKAEESSSGDEDSDDDTDTGRQRAGSQRLEAGSIISVKDEEQPGQRLSSAQDTTARRQQSSPSPARTSSVEGLTSALQTQSAASPFPSSAATLQADVRRAIDVLVNRGYREDDAEKRVEKQLERMRARERARDVELGRGEQYRGAAHRQEATEQRNDNASREDGDNDFQSGFVEKPVRRQEASEEDGDGSDDEDPEVDGGQATAGNDSGSVRPFVNKRQNGDDQGWRSQPGDGRSDHRPSTHPASAQVENIVDLDPSISEADGTFFERALTERDSTLFPDDQSLVGARQVQSDSGYQTDSLVDKMANTIATGNTFQDNASVKTDNQSLYVPTEVKERLIRIFADELCSELDFQNDEQKANTSRLIGFIPNLLKNFTLLKRDMAKSRMEDKAATFVRHSRNAICGQLNDILSTPSPPFNIPDDTEMDLNDKISRWSTQPEMSAEEECAAIESAEGLDFPVARRFLFDGEEFDWLLARLRAAVSMDAIACHVFSAVQNSFFHEVWRSEASTSSQVHTMRIESVWNPREYLSEQFMDPRDYPLEQFSSVVDVDLGSTIVIARHQSSIYATTCRQYLEQVWPVLGSDILSAVQKLIESEEGRTNAMVNGASVKLQRVANTTFVVATGTLVSLNNIFEVMVWLGTACRASRDPYDISICEPVVVSDQSTALSFQVHFELRKMPQQQSIEARDTCWHAMFRNPAIAQGYPVPTRYGGEVGLEVSPEMMVVLAQTQTTVCYRGRIVLKGFNSALAPTHLRNKSVLWHFVVNTKSEYLPYDEGIVHSTLSSYKEAFFPGARHFVAWTDSAEIVPSKYRRRS